MSSDIQTADNKKPVADPRHEKRIELLKLLFAFSFRPKQEPVEQLKKIVVHLPEIDQTISALAPERPLTEISKIDLAILRLIVFEWTDTKTPKKVLINEAIELAKEFGADASPKFINGALSQLLTNNK